MFLVFTHPFSLSHRLTHTNTHTHTDGGKLPHRMPVQSTGDIWGSIQGHFNMETGEVEDQTTDPRVGHRAPGHSNKNTDRPVGHPVGGDRNIE